MQQSYRVLILACGLLSFCVALRGQPLITVDQGFTEASVDEELRVLPDDKGSLKLSQVHDFFMASAQANDQAWQDITAVWSSVKIANTTAATQELMLSAGDIDRVHLHIPSDSSGWKVLKSGWAVSRSERVFKGGDFKKPTFPLTLQPNSEIQLYLRLANPSGKEIQPQLQVSSKLYWEATTYKDAYNFRFILGVAIGLSGIMAAYNLLIGLFGNMPVYRYYALYIISGCVYLLSFGGFFINTLLGEVVFIYPLLRSLSPTIGLVAYIVFTQLFLNTKQVLPRWHTVANGIKYALLGLGILLILVLPFTLNEAYSRKIASMVHLLSQLIMVVFAVQLLFHRKNPLFQYYAVGALLFTGAAVFFAYSVLSAKVSVQLGLSVEVVGFALELTAFSLGLGYKVKKMEKDRLDAQRKVASILKNQKAELEEKVQERTQELLHKNEEILTQNEELHQQQEEIVAQRDHIEEQNRSLADKNKSITDSIRYARKIQQAILPSERQLEGFAECMVFYSPKDLVSGDFYWYEKVGDTHLLAVADCTGHGVPGGFMSMLGFATMNDIALKAQETSPAQILEQINHTFLEIFRPDEQEMGHGIQDGMDMGLCAITYNSDRKSVKVVFSGAKRMMYIGKEEEIEEVPGSRKAIGGRQAKGSHFENRELELPLGTAIYLDTDGFADQNNQLRRKYGRQEFKQLLSEITPLPMSEQKEHISRAFLSHKGKEKQRDDIAIIGIRV